MSNNKIEPTDAMVDKAANVLCLDATGTSLRFHAELEKRTYRTRMRTALCAALNHPDARGLLPFEVVDALRAAREQGWDQAARKAMDGGWIDSGDYADLRAWNPHRATQELPTEDGAVIVPADGCEFIAMTDAEGWTFDRMTYSAEHDRWYGMTKRGAIAMCSAEQIAPGTWQTA